MATLPAASYLDFPFGNYASGLLTRGTVMDSSVELARGTLHDEAEALTRVPFLRARVTKDQRADKREAVLAFLARERHSPD